MRRITGQDHSDDENFYWNKEICISYGCKFSLMCTGLPLHSLFLHFLHDSFRHCEHVMYGREENEISHKFNIKEIFFFYISVTDLTVSVSDQIRFNSCPMQYICHVKMPMPCVRQEKITLI